MNNALYGIQNNEFIQFNTTTWNSSGTIIEIGWGLGKISVDCLYFYNSKLWFAGIRASNPIYGTINTSTGIASEIGDLTVRTFGVAGVSGTYYGVGFSNTLYRFTPANGNFTELGVLTGQSSGEGINNLAVLGSEIYAMGHHGNLYQLTVSSRTLVKVGGSTRFGLGSINSPILVSVNNILYMVDRDNDKLYSLENGVAVRIGNVTKFDNSVGSPVALGSVGASLFLVNSETDGQVFYKFDGC